MKRFVFDLVPFEKEVTAIDGKKANITLYGKVIEKTHFDNDEKKPIQKVKVLEVINIEEYATDAHVYGSDKQRDGISRVVEYSENSLPHELGIYLSTIG